MCDKCAGNIQSLGSILEEYKSPTVGASEPTTDPPGEDKRRARFKQRIAGRLTRKLVRTNGGGTSRKSVVSPSVCSPDKDENGFSL